MSHSFATPLTVAHQAPLFIGFSRQGYCSGLPFPPPGDLSGPGIEPASPELQVDALLLSHLGNPNLTLVQVYILIILENRTFCIIPTKAMDIYMFFLLVSLDLKRNLHLIRLP